jgi:hypothetical protein
LSGRKIKNAQQFKNALIEVDLSQLNEEIITLIQDKMFDDSVFKKLRETPFEKFEDAPDGEKVSFCVTHNNQLIFFSCWLCCHMLPICQSVCVPFF